MTYDLETLRLIAWAVLGLILLGLAIFEGMSLGLLMLIPLIGESIAQRRALTISAAPTTLGSLTWWLTFLSVLFAAWPIAYAVSLRSLQSVFWLMSLTLMLRPVLLYFYDDLGQTVVRPYLDKSLGLCGWLPAALMGLSLGNLLKGVPFHLESDMHIAFLGDTMSLMHLFGALVSITCVSLVLMHGASYCLSRSLGSLQTLARSVQLRAGLGFLLSFAVTGLWITHLEGYHVTSDILTQATSNPLAKFVKRGEGLWLDNYEHEPALIIIPTLAFLSAIATLWLGRSSHHPLSIITSSMTVAMALLTVGVSLFPFLLPSNLSLNSSLTIWDSSASQATLSVLLAIAGIALPLLMIMQRWIFHLFNQEINLD